MKNQFTTYLLSELINIPISERLKLIEKHICSTIQNITDSNNSMGVDMGQSELIGLQ